MRTILALGICLLVSIAAGAQGGRTKAIVTAGDGSSRTVFVRPGAGNGTPQSISVAATDTGPFQPLDLSDIRRITLENGTVLEPHVIAVWEINKPYIERNDEDVHRIARPQPGVRLVERVLDAPYSLYLYEDQYGYPHFFYSSAQDTTLAYIVNSSYTDAARVYRRDESYKDRLRFLATQGSCAAATKLAGQLDYKLTDFSRYFVALNACTGTAVQNDAAIRNRGTRFSWFVAAGASRFKLQMPDKGGPQAVCPEFGVGVHLVPKNGTARGSVVVEGLVHLGSADAVLVPLNGNAYNTHVKLDAAKLNVLGQYRFGTGTNAIFAGGGVSLHYLFSPFDLDSYYEFGRSQFAFGLLLNAGYSFSRFSLGARYLIGTGAGKNSASFSGPGVQLRYHFN